MFDHFLHVNGKGNKPRDVIIDDDVIAASEDEGIVQNGPGMDKEELECKVQKLRHDS